MYNTNRERSEGPKLVKVSTSACAYLGVEWSRVDELPTFRQYTAENHKHGCDVQTSVHKKKDPNDRKH